MDYAHVFRRDSVNHVAMTNRPRVRRNGRHHTICGKRIDETFMRRVPFGDGRIVPVDCEICMAFMVALSDIVDEDDRRKEARDE